MLLRKFKIFRTKICNEKMKKFHHITKHNKNFSDEIIKLTHTGENKMVNVGKKIETLRYARACCFIKVKPEIIEHIRSNSSTKGDVLRISEVAGILAAKKTSELIPLCHQINLDTVNINIRLESEHDKQELFENVEKSINTPTRIQQFNKIYIESYAESFSKTGVEMEAMVSVSIAALTIYDMCKSVDKSIVISEIKLIEKFGGKSGHYVL